MFPLDFFNSIGQKRLFTKKDIDMLLRQTSIDEIRLGLAVLQGYVGPGGPLNLTNINIHAEDSVGGVVNLLNG
jgi:hypothetical protein